MYDWAFAFPHFPLDTVMDTRQQTSGRDKWFAYDQFEFVQDWLPKVSDGPSSKVNCQIIQTIGAGAALLAAFGGNTFEIAASTFTVVYAMRFFSLVQFFTNHFYLFFLILILLTLSGGGDLNLKRVAAMPKDKRRKLVQRCEWAAITIRSQYATIYLFASLWKLTPDWIDGSIVKGIMLSFEDSGVARGIPWSSLYEFWPGVFVIVAMGGLALDAGMGCALWLRRPSQESSALFLAMSVAFHSFVAFTMSQRIGYSFPAVCLAGSLLFLPLAQHTNKGDASLMEWIKRYAIGSPALARASPWQRRFTLLWVTIQLVLPLRMPLISGGAFPFTSQGYRFSWTMMLHNKNDRITHTGGAFTSDGHRIERVLHLELSYLLPTCPDSRTTAKDSYILRSQYMPQSETFQQDSRTLPLITMLNSARQLLILGVYPRHFARVAGGIAPIFSGACPGQPNIAVYGVNFVKLNDHGAFCRLFDPTVDLVAADRARKQQNVWQSWRSIALDRAPEGNEYLLLKGLGTSRARVSEWEDKLKSAYPGKPIHFIADRAACLASRPLFLSPEGFPLIVVALQSPNNRGFFLKSRTGGNPSSQSSHHDLSEAEHIPLALQSEKAVMATSLEIGIDPPPRGTKPDVPCGETSTEDVLLALVLMA
jgi:hypothetical protein